MFKRFNSAKEAIRRHAAAKVSRVGAGLAVMALASPAFAQESTPAWQTLFNAIGIEGLAAAIVVLLLIVVAVAMSFKGSDLSKRVIRKV